MLAHLHPVHGAFASSQRTPFRMQQAARCCQPSASPGRSNIYIGTGRKEDEYGESEP